jgi:hypothetical protein
MLHVFWQRIFTSRADKLNDAFRDAFRDAFSRAIPRETASYRQRGNH